MTTTYIQEGKTVTVTTPTGGYTSGQFVPLPAAGATQKMIGVSSAAYAAGETAVLLTEGVYNCTKLAGAGEAWLVGDDLYAATGMTMTEVATANGYAGVAWEAAATGATTGKIRINFGGDPR